MNNMVVFPGDLMVVDTTCSQVYKTACTSFHGTEPEVSEDGEPIYRGTLVLVLSDSPETDEVYCLSTSGLVGFLWKRSIQHVGHVA